MQNISNFMKWRRYEIFKWRDRETKKNIDAKNRKKTARYKCFVCEREFYSYYPLELSYIALRSMYTKEKIQLSEEAKQYSCPYCGALNRVRMMFMYLERSRFAGIKHVLYMSATHAGLEYFRKNHPDIEVITNDLYVDEYDYHYDIENMYGFVDGQFDLIICSHILEHVNNDIRALEEMYRVTKRGGKIIIIVPLQLREGFDEDTKLSEEDNWKRFGDGTHVRAYSKTAMKERIESLGYSVELIEKESFDNTEQQLNALRDCDVIYVINK
ncbi:MAG: class I SAM-dependent methyltransferase [Lachnospiraceae bacterium]|nr:class I SAM-dependent methyltransferase [Lachnospiraceae bacterium]